MTLCCNFSWEKIWGNFFFQKLSAIKQSKLSQILFLWILPSLKFVNIWKTQILGKKTILTLTLLTWIIWWASNNASKWKIVFDSAFKGLICPVFRALTLILLTWRIWWATKNDGEWQMGFNSAFKGLICPVFRALTLILLTWRIWWATKNDSEWQMGFNSELNELNKSIIYIQPIKWTSVFMVYFIHCILTDIFWPWRRPQKRPKQVGERLLNKKHH